MRRTLDVAARCTGVLQWHERQMRRAPTLLMYHRILPSDRLRDYPFPSLAVSTDAFEQQVAWLARNTNVVTACDAVHQTFDSSSDGRPVVAVTFDDGYDDNYELAAPILDRHGLHGTFYVATGFLAGDLLWYDRAALVIPAHEEHEIRAVAAECGVAAPDSSDDPVVRVERWVEALKRSSPSARRTWLSGFDTPSPEDANAYASMSQEQVADLARRGHEVASHSVSHEMLPQLDDDALANELRESKTALADWLQADVAGFCYPNGSYDDRVVAAVRAAGYTYAVTTQDPSVVDRASCGAWRVPRIDMNPTRFMCGEQFDLLAFRAEVSGLHARMR